MGRIPKKVQIHRWRAWVNDLGIKVKRITSRHPYITTEAELSKVKLEIRYKDHYRPIYREIKHLTGTLIRPKFGFIMIIGSATDITLAAYLVEYIETYMSIYAKTWLDYYRRSNKSKRALMRKYPNWEMGGVTDARILTSNRKIALRSKIRVILEEVEQHNPMRILFHRKLEMIKFRLNQKYSRKWKRKI